MRKYSLIILVFVVSTAQSQISEKLFDDLLQQHVDTLGLIDYAAFNSDRNFQILIEEIAQASVDSLNRNQRLAFYLNAYNILVVKNVLDNQPLISPLDVDGFFKKIKFAVAGEQLTLDEIEYNKVFPIDDVLVHFGLVCAALSCPRLIREAYRAGSVWQQLETNGRRFLQNMEKNRLDRKNNILYLSKIFEWFRSNFEKRSGSLLNFAVQFMSESDVRFIKASNPPIKFLDYNWKLNQQQK